MGTWWAQAWAPHGPIGGPSLGPPWAHDGPTLAARERGPPGEHRLYMGPGDPGAQGPPLSLAAFFICTGFFEPPDFGVIMWAQNISDVMWCARYFSPILIISKNTIVRICKPWNRVVQPMMRTQNALPHTKHGLTDPTSNTIIYIYIYIYIYI